MGKITAEDVERMERAANDAGLGYNTQDMGKRYAKDVRALLEEREELLAKLEAVGKQSAPPTKLEAIAKEVVESNAAEEVDG